MRRTFVAFVVAAFVWLWSGHASAYAPPPINGHVMDSAGALTQEQVLALDAKLERVRQDKGFAIVVFLPKSLEGQTMEDVAYDTFNTWKIGSAKGDDGVLLVVALAEHKTRIETGKGVGGALTDIGSSHIDRETINPLLQQGKVYEALDQGTDRIVNELTTGTPGGTSDPGRGPAARGHGNPRPGAHGQVAAPSPVASIGRVVIWGAIILAVIILSIISPTFRSFLFYVLLFGRGGGGGGGGFGGGGGGGSGYGGGGGSSGGGGSTDDW